MTVIIIIIVPAPEKSYRVKACAYSPLCLSIFSKPLSCPKIGRAVLVLVLTAQ